LKSTNSINISLFLQKSLRLSPNQAETIPCYYKHPLEKVFRENYNIKVSPHLCLNFFSCLPDSMPLAFQVSFYFIVTAPTTRKKKIGF